MENGDHGYQWDGCRSLCYAIEVRVVKVQNPAFKCRVWFLRQAKTWEEKCSRYLQVDAVIPNFVWMAIWWNVCGRALSEALNEFQSYYVHVSEIVIESAGKFHIAWIVSSSFNKLKYIKNSHSLEGDATPRLLYKRTIELTTWNSFKMLCLKRRLNWSVEILCW